MWLSPETTPPYGTVASAVASLAASVILLRSITDDLIPESIITYFTSHLQRMFASFSSQLTVVVEESDGLNPNKMFEAASIYLGSKLSPTTGRIRVHKQEKEKELDITIDKNQEIVDEFNGVKLKWALVSSPIIQKSSDKNKGGIAKLDLRRFELGFHKKHREMVLRAYLPFVLQSAKEIKEEKKAIKLHTVDYHGRDYWGAINLDHPSTFDTIAMEPETKQALIEDLDRFVGRRGFYRQVGKAWKRGYLLYGPPGTGKSSLVAAMANHLKFDVYDLDLKEVQCDSDLRRLLIGTGNRSILVIEDIDCSMEAGDDDKITLSGLLNFVDGLWSSCGDERIIVFTTNHRDKLDPALLRPGRMDVHLHMSYCTFRSFKTLAFNYLKIRDHRLFSDIEELLRNVDATPAEVAAELMKSEDVEKALGCLIRFLEGKKGGSEESVENRSSY